MSVTREDVVKVAKLANIAIDEGKPRTRVRQSLGDDLADLAGAPDSGENDGFP